MKIMLFGGTGFIGKYLVAALKRRGNEVLSRDVRRDFNFKAELESCDAVINLGGAGLFDKRWTPKYKEALYDSRIESTRQIVDAMGAAKLKSATHPKVLINASAIGYYGESDGDTFTEDSPAGSDFLAFVCKDWEVEAEKARLRHGIRTVITRFGVVLGQGGGALAQLLTPFKAFVGGPVGNGKQYMSWVHVDDVCGIILHALENEGVNGVLNAVAPNPVTNKEFSQALGHALHRPSFMRVPKLGLYALLGEVASLVTVSQRVLPKRTLESGYHFRYENIKTALESVVSDTATTKLATSAA